MTNTTQTRASTRQRRLKGTGPPPRARPTRAATSEDEIASLGFAIDATGLDAHRDEVLHLATEASSLVPVAASVLASEAEPEVARLRAFAIVSSALVREISSRGTGRHGTVVRT